MVYFFIHMKYFEIVKTKRVSPKGIYSSVCPFNKFGKEYGKNILNKFKKERQAQGEQNITTGGHTNEIIWRA